MLIDRRLACGLCVALALAVITIFILPSTQGPYSVVRGPATVFQAARAAPCARCSGARAIVPRFRLSNFAFLFMSSITVANTESTLGARERKSTRLNSTHEWISYAVFCWKKKRLMASATV